MTKEELKKKIREMITEVLVDYPFREWGSEMTIRIKEPEVFKERQRVTQCYVDECTDGFITLFDSQIDRIGGDSEQKLIDVEDLLTTFCADIYGYAHKKKEVFGENREYFVTLEELDRVFTAFIGNLKSKSGGIKKFATNKLRRTHNGVGFEVESKSGKDI